MALTATIKNRKVHVGDTVSVHQEIVEDEKKRTQVFAGVVISIKGHGTGKSFTVRKIAHGSIGVERIWPIISPSIKKIEVNKEGSVRRSKLYYLRERTGKSAIKIKTREKIKVTDKAKPSASKQSKTAKKKKEPAGASKKSRKKG